ncbi:MAG: cell surface protein SprA [bacterium]
MFLSMAIFSLLILSAMTIAADGEIATTHSIQFNLKVIEALDLREWERPFTFTQDMLANTDTTVVLLKTEITNFKKVVEVDSVAQTIKFRFLFYDKDWVQPIVFSREQYINYRMRTDVIKQFRQASLDALREAETKGGGEALTIEIPFKIKSKTFNKIFGGDRVRLRISGSININGGFRREDDSQVATMQGQETDYSFQIDQTQQFKIKGEIGDKVSVEVDQNSERMFEFENSLKLTYTGYEDEIIQKIEAGNISLQLPGTKLATFSGQNKGLFGIKADLKVGALTVTTIASLEKGEKNKLSVTGGAQEAEVTIPINQPAKGRYFFLGYDYRNNFTNYDASMTHTAPAGSPLIFASDFYVYKKYTLGSGVLPADMVYAYAVYDSLWDETDPEGFYNKSAVDSLEALGEIDNKMFQPGNYVPLNAGQYTIDTQLGYIRLSTPLTNPNDVLAVMYATNDGTTYGSLSAQTGDTLVLKLLRPENPHPSDQTYDLEWRNVYSLQGGNVEPEGFTARIVYSPSGTNEQETIEFDGQQETFLTLFGLDTKNESGQNNPDGKIDANPALINYSYGEIIFPDLRPFDPDQGYRIFGEYAPYWGNPALYPDSLSYPSIYDSTQLLGTNFSIKAEFKSVQAVYQLGFNVLEGSEEVYLSGRRLNRGSDYVIDYYSGTLTILNQAALSPSANLEIVYESGELFQLDKKTLLGVRAEYALWDQSFIGFTALYLNEKPLQDRVRIGNEPLRNFLWDVNTSMTFKPKFLTRAIDFLPLVETDVASQLKLELEYAQVHPNPNSLNNSATGDPNGVAYVDDFESIRKTSPLGIMRRQWRQASYPSFAGENKPQGLFVWFNPYDQIDIKDIWPNRPTNANVAQQTHVLTCYFSPAMPDSLEGPLKADSLTTSWGGIQRALSAGYQNQENSKYIEIMLRVRELGTNRFNTPGKLHIDLGQISEDVIANGVLDTEDQPLGQDIPYGDGFASPEEDIGLDGRNGNDPSDWWELDNDSTRDANEPASMDDWYFDPSNPYNVWRINGTEGNYEDEGGRYPDTEDLDNDNFLDVQKNFFRYTLDLSETNPGVSYPVGPGGQWYPTPQWLVTEPNDKGWKMYRIPLESGETFGTPSLQQIQYVRVWMDGFSDTDTIEVAIATLEIVGNEWEAVAQYDPLTGLTYEPISVATINTYDDPNYEGPPGVQGERDPVTDIISQEQSLVMRIIDLADSTSGLAVRQLYQPLDFLEYRKLKMFVHGGGSNSDSNEVVFSQDDKQVWMFFRFGSDTTRNYYEYKQRVWPNWDSRNNIEIDLETLPSLKRIDLPDTMVYSDNDTISVMGNPSLSQIKQFTLGMMTYGFDAAENEALEIWFDELRVSEVKKDVGRKARANADLTLADLATLNFGMEVSDGDFHNVNTRAGTRKNAISGNATGTLKVDKFLEPEWGLSIPVNGNYSFSEETPYYFSNSDILVDDTDPAQVDTVKTYRQSYGGGVNVSKNTPSASPYLKYTIDNLSGGYDYSFSESSTPTTSLSTQRSHSANTGYRLTLGRPSVPIFGWLSNVPVLKKYSDIRLFPLITKIDASLSGTESLSETYYRSGNEQFSQTLFLTKTAATGWRPFEVMSFDWQRTHKADMRMDPNNPKDISNIAAGDLGWDEDMDVSQSITATYNPSLISWLDTDFRYNTTYHWSWGQGYIQSGQTISNNNSINVSGNLKLTQIFKPPTRPATQGDSQGQPGSGTQEPQTGGDKGGGAEEPGGEGETPDSLGTSEEGDSTRAFIEIEKPKRRSAILDLWYGMRYTVSRLKDVRIDYTQSKNWQDPLVSGQAGLLYQIGLDPTDYSKISNAGDYTGFSSRTRNDQYKFSSGIDFSRNFKINMSYNYDWNKSESSNVTGSYSHSRMYFFQTGGDSVKVMELPIPNWSATLSGLEKTPFFENLAQTVSLENSYTGSKKTSWTETRSNVKQNQYTRNFSPLLGVNITWKGGVSSSLRYNWTESGDVNIFPTASKSRSTQRGATVSASYKMKTGFKIPIPVWPFKNKRFKNETTFSLAFNYSKNRQENESEGKFIETSFSDTWSIKPSLDYQFSSTVRGGMHFEYGANKSKTRDSNFQEFGISVQIQIKG